jgi:4-hydroxybenzoate polyprenyltransferase
MATWVLIVFLLGLLALVFHLFNIFQWFTPWWAVVLMAIAFGMLTRIWRKEREGEKEKLVEKIQELEGKLQKGKE